jgi:hypothetical protein
MIKLPTTQMKKKLDATMEFIRSAEINPEKLEDARLQETTKQS